MVPALCPWDTPCPHCWARPLRDGEWPVSPVGDPTLLHKGYRDMLKWHGENRAVPFGDTGLYGKLHA